MSILVFEHVVISDHGALALPINLSLAAGERLVIFGPSGSGKSALLKVAAGIREPMDGDVRLSAGGRAMPVGYVARDGGLVNNLTLLDNAALPLLYHRTLERPVASEKARALLAELGVERAAGLRPAAASVSSRRLTQLARAWLAAPALFVLESPLDEIDASRAKAVRRMLDWIKEAPGVCAILGTGSPKPYLEWGTQFMLVDDERVRHFPSLDELLGDPDPEIKLFTA